MPSVFDCIYIYVLFIISLFGYSHSLASQDLKLHHTHFNDSNGLSHRQANAIFEDEDGDIWVATMFGLNKLEGDRFVPITPKDQNLRIENVSRVGQDDEGFLWLWNDHTIYFYNKYEGKFSSLKERFPLGLPFDLVLKKEGSWKMQKQSGIIKSPNGNLIFESPDRNGVYLYNSKDKFRFVQIEKHKVQKVLGVDDENLIFVSTDHAILKIDEQGNVLEEKFVNDALDVGYFYLKNNGLFFESKHKAYHLNKYGDLKKIDFLEGIKFLYDHISRRFYDLQSNGIFIYDEKGKLLLKIPNSKSNKKLFEYQNDLFTDSNGAIWIVTDYGVSKIQLEPKLFERYVSFEKDQHPIFNSVRSIVIQNNTLFANLEMGGLVKVDLSVNNPKQFKIVYNEIEDHYTKNPNKLKIDYWGRALVIGDKGNLWVGGRESIIQIDTTGNILNKFALHQQTKQSDVWSLHFEENLLWIGTGNGISFLDLNVGNRFSKFLPSEEFKMLNEAVVLAFIPDGNNIWACTENGLYLFDKKTMKIVSSFFTLDSDHPLKVHHLLKDKFIEDTYWVSTSSGLVKWNKKSNSRKTYDKSNGFINDNIYCAIQDANKFLWLSTDLGIVRFDQGTDVSKIFTETNGIANNEFNRTSYTYTDDGRIYFGGMNGVTRFHPADFLSNSDRDERFIFKLNEFIVENSNLERRSLNIQKANFDKSGFQINADDQKLILSLVSDSDYFGGKTQYKYRIKGQDSIWLYSNDGKISLKNLTKNSFVLEVKGRTINRLWGQEIITIPIVVKRDILDEILNSGLPFLLVIAIGGLFLIYFISTLFKKKRVVLDDALPKNKDFKLNHEKQKTVVISSGTKQDEQKFLKAKEDQAKWLDELNLLVLENLADNRFSIEFLADKMHMSRRNLQRKIKLAVGLSPKAHINNLRLAKAKEFLESGKYKTIKDTSDAIGIKNQSYFSELFKEKYGLNPTEIIKKDSK